MQGVFFIFLTLVMLAMLSEAARFVQYNELPIKTQIGVARKVAADATRAFLSVNAKLAELDLKYDRLEIWNEMAASTDMPLSGVEQLELLSEPGESSRRFNSMSPWRLPWILFDGSVGIKDYHDFLDACNWPSPYYKVILTPDSPWNRNNIDLERLDFEELKLPKSLRSIDFRLILDPAAWSMRLSPKAKSTRPERLGTVWGPRPA